MPRKKLVHEEAGPKGAPDWIVTFTDMISLLVTFFVLLMTFSSMEDYDRLRVDGWLRGGFSPIDQIGGDLAYESPEDDIVSATDARRGANRPHSRPFQHLEQNLAEMGQTQRADELEVDFSALGDGLQIVFGPACSFEPGSARVGVELEKRLSELADVLRYYPHLVVVEGFTDGAFKPTELHPDAHSLGMARALAAVDVMLASGELTSELLQAATLGSTRPRADDRTPEGRRENRRVEIRVISLSKGRADHLESERREEIR